MSSPPGRLAFPFAVLAAALLAAGASAAPPLPPDEVSYQGLLLDGNGNPRAGSVDLTARIFDALDGGTLLYSQVFLAVPLTDGVFTVSLGPTGASTDSPVDPLTISLADALVADLGATGPERFLEITVGSETALVRTQILAVPYALHAATAADAGAVGGLDSLAMTQIYEYTNLDMEDPPNTDPLEGLDDVDGDGASNFVDPDNDGDGIADGTELANGTALNLVTPTLTAVDPALANADLTTTVTLSGSSFEAGMSVEIGSESPTPSISSATTLEVEVGPQTPGLVDVTVTRLNGESATLGLALEFRRGTLPHPVNPGGQLSLAVKGAQQTILGNRLGYAVDTNADLVPELTQPFGTSGQLAVAWSPSGAAVGLRCRFVVPQCAVELAVDSDADFELADETGTAIETVPVFEPQIQSPSLAFDPSGNPAAGYITGQSLVFTAVVIHDRDGNGDFGGANERVEIETVTSNPTVGEIAFDPSGRIVHVYRKNDETLRVAYDRSGDGDFDDVVDGNPELFDLASGGGGTFTCVGVAFDSAGRLAVAFGGSGHPLGLARDLDQDGDFTGPGEVTSLTAGDVLACDVEGGAGLGLAVAHDDAGDVKLLVDRDDDGDFLGTNEAILVPTAPAPGAVEVRRNASGQVVLATDREIFLDLL